MNLKIRQLASQCWETTNRGVPIGNFAEFNKEKFAELIIQECMMIAKSSHINSSDKKYILEGWNAACYSIHDNIEEYFGVEE